MFSYIKRKYKETFNKFSAGDLIQNSRPDYIEEWEEYNVETWEVFKVGNEHYLVRCDITSPFYLNMVKNKSPFRSNNSVYGERGDGYYYTSIDKTYAALFFKKNGQTPLKLQNKFSKDLKNLLS